MSNEQLTAYLKDESYLYSLSYEEIKTLVVEYPYASNLRVLLLKKSYIDKNKDYDRNLQMAAAYTTNRRHLYSLVQKLKTQQFVPENVILGEDYLELKELSNIEKMLQERHVSEVFNEKKPLGDSKSSVQWSGIEFEDTGAGTSTMTLSSTDYLEFASSELENFDDTLNFSEPLEMSSETSPSIDFLNRNSDSKVELAIESIMAEFGSMALDLTGDGENVSDDKSILKEGDVVSDDIIFENDDDIEEELSIENAETETELSNQTLTEIPREILNFGDQDPELEGIPTEKIEATVDKEFNHFEELEDKSVIEETISVNYEQNEPKIQVLDFDALDTKNSDDFQDDDAIIENILLETPQSGYLTDRFSATLPNLESESQPEIHMKKRDIEIEIVNNSKATVVENAPLKQENAPAVSFTEWLRQFKMATSPSMGIVAPVIQKEKKTEEIISKTTEPTEIKHVLDDNIVALLFEKPSELPDNLFGFNSVKPSHDTHEKQDSEDSSDDFEDLFAVKKKKKKKQMHELAAKSIEESNDLISETLADLLAWQGNIKKALEMYERLCLQFPEKSDYFAAKIEKLRNTEK